MDSDYLGLVMKEDRSQDIQMRVWHPGYEMTRFVVKMKNDEEDTIPRIWFFGYDPGDSVFRLMPEPEGLWYSGITDFIIPRDGKDIEVTGDYFPQTT